MAKQEAQEPRFSKEQLLAADRFAGWEKDVLAAVLPTDGQYTLTEVEQHIADFVVKEAL